MALATDIDLARYALPPEKRSRLPTARSWPQRSLSPKDHPLLHPFFKLKAAKDRGSGLAAQLLRRGQSFQGRSIPFSLLTDVAWVMGEEPGQATVNPNWGCHQRFKAIPTEEGSWIELPVALDLPVALQPVLLSIKLRIPGRDTMTIHAQNQAIGLTYGEILRVLYVATKGNTSVQRQYFDGLMLESPSSRDKPTYHVNLSPL